MNDDILITLEGLLKTIKSSKAVTINLYHMVEVDGEQVKQLLISFLLPGYECLDDFLMDDEVTEIEILNSTSINITIDTSKNEPTP